MDRPSIREVVVKITPIDGKISIMVGSDSYTYHSMKYVKE